MIHIIHELKMNFNIIRFMHLVGIPIVPLKEMLLHT